MRRKKVLIICNYPVRTTGGQRFRFEQYLDYLRDHGFDFEISSLMNVREAKLLYSKGHLLSKGWILAKGLFIRIKDVFRCHFFDIVFIFREGFLAGPPIFERLFSWSSAKLIFDFDDAIWNHDVSEANKRFAFLKWPKKTGTIISYCDMVFAGNDYLADYARKTNSNVKILPTTVDDEVYLPVSKSPNPDQICIGWTGSKTTIKHFELCIPALKKVKEKYGSKVKFLVIGDGQYYNRDLGIQGLEWNLENETENISSIDIGVMPLPDDEWSKGKCGFKALQYMALGVPAIVSPVGVNKLIIEDGVCGYFAVSTQEWVEKISVLVDNAELRLKMGAAGRRVLVSGYSKSAHKDRYVEFFKEVVGAHNE